MLSSDWMVWLCFWAVRFRQEEKRQLEESSKVKERKRKREKYAERVGALIEEQGIDYSDHSENALTALVQLSCHPASLLF